MFRIHQTSALGMIALFVFQNAVAQDDGFKLEPMHALAAWEAGEVEAFVPDPSAAVVPGKDKQLIDHAAVWLLQEARLSDNTKAFLGVGGAYFFILPSAGNPYSFGQRSAFALTDAHGEFEFWKQGEDDHGLLLKVGVFPYKYDDDAKNLGEYMFRTYTYPTVIFTGGLTLVNSTQTQLNGMDANTKIGGLDNDLLLTVKTDQVPTSALSLTDIFSYTVKDILTLGAGYMFDNFFDPTGIAKGNFAAGGSLSEGDYFVLKDGTVDLNTSNPPADSLVADTGHYTFVGQKVMARAALDFGKLLPENQILSPGDLRLYGEGILMGVKDYPGYYDKMWNRIAYMVGFNFPTFRALDLLSLEFEYCKNPYVNSSTLATLDLVPVPNASSNKIFNRDNLKWTVYARKNVYKTFSISAQVATDHLRLVDYFGHTNDQEVLQNPQDWYWAVQFGYAI